MKRFLARSDLPVWFLVPAGWVMCSMLGDPFATFFLMLATAVLLLLSAVLLFRLSGKHERRHVLVYSFSIVLFVGFSLTQFPLRISFAVSEPALRRIAMNVEGGNQVSVPVWAGLYRIREVGRRDDGSVYLWTNPNPAGPDGFVFRYTGTGYNLWSELRLKDDWYFICED